MEKKSIVSESDFEVLRSGFGGSSSKGGSSGSGGTVSYIADTSCVPQFSCTKGTYGCLPVDKPTPTSGGNSPGSRK